MCKPLLIIISLFLLQTRANFNIKTAKCLLRVLLKNIETTDITDDSQIIHLKKTMSEENNEEIKLFNDVKIISDLNNLLINYDNLEINLKNEINLCEIDTSKILEKCQKHNKECFKINDVSYGIYCDKNYIQSHNYLCYKKCAEGFVENGVSCQKPMGTLLKVFNSKKICEEIKGVKCDSYMDDTFATEKCPVFHKKLFKTICLPVCEDGLLDDGENCMKRNIKHLPNPYIFNFNDLFD